MHKLISIFFLFFSGILIGQRNIKVLTLGTDESVPNVIFSCATSSQIDESDEYGNVVLDKSCPKYIVNRIGYFDTLFFNENLSDTFFMRQDSKLEEVIIIDHRVDASKKQQYRFEFLDKMPVIGGEKDIIKALSYTAGVNQVTEGTSSLSVRGGSPDQNLIMMDGAKIYNVNHLFGFLSSINSEVVKDMNFYKSYFPSKYESRISSVTNVIMKDGRKDVKKKGFQIGTISSSGFIEGPLKNKKSSYILGFRTAYPTLLFAPRALTESYFNYLFYDLNGKLSLNSTKFGNVTFSLHSNTDYTITVDRDVSKKDKLNLSWGNNAFVINTNKAVGKKMFLNSTTALTTYLLSYRASYQQDSIKNSLLNSSKLFDINSKIYIDYLVNNAASFKIGIFGQKINYFPFESQISYDKVDYNIDAQQYKNDAFGTFMDVELNMGSFKFLFGIRIEKWKLDEQSKPLFIQPRISISKSFGLDQSLSLEYSKVDQTIQSLSSSAGSYLMDVWLPSGSKLLPQSAQMLNLSYFINKINWQAGVEIYYKKLKNQSLLTPGFDLLTSKREEEWLTKIITDGIGDNYGSEFYFNTKIREFDIKMNYTLSWSKRRFDKINNGESFYSDYDKRHNLNIISSINLPRNWSLSGAFVFGTGRPFSAPEASILSLYNGSLYPVFKKYNNARFPINNRLDLAFSKLWKSRSGKEKKLTLSIYNAYAYKNIFSIHYYGKANFITDEFGLSKRVTSIFRFIPGLSYSIRW